ncbi:MAG: hypothetical protein WBG46_04970 [Nonlabens sp.]
MDQLDILKSKWQSQEASLPKYSADQIKNLLHHKSSSIVKWLLIIAIGEFIFFGILAILSLFLHGDHNIVEIFGKGYIYGHTAFHYTVIFIFIYLFYKNYKNISVDQPSRSLMKNILKTRRTMKYYIWYNIAYMIIGGMWTAWIALDKDPAIIQLRENLSTKLDEQLLTLSIMGVYFVLLIVICLFLFLFYQLIYGILLRKLNRNYQELKRMEV